MITQNFPFTTPGNYNATNVLVDSGVAKLALIDNPGQLFEQPFDNDTGFTYDNTKAEFVAGMVQQKDQTPADSLLGITYNSALDDDWSKVGNITRTNVGAPTISGGKLSLNGSSAVDYIPATPLARKFVVRFKYTPDYSGNPPTQKRFWGFRNNNTGGLTQIFLYHNTNGQMTLQVINNSNNVVLAKNFGSWNPTSGQEYVFETTVDLIGGDQRMFIDGVQLGTPSTFVSSNITTLTRFIVGSSIETATNPASGLIDDFVVFSEVQNTSNHSAAYSIPETIYVGSVVQLPAFSYSGIGTIQAVESSNIVETGTPRYIVAGLYWDGAAWVPSNGTYAQANTSADVIANLPALSVQGAENVPVSVLFQDSNSQSDVDLISVTVTGQRYSPDGHVEPVQSLQISAIDSLALVVTETANAELRIILRIDGVLKYWDGAAWVTSDGSFAQANTLADFNANIDELDLGSNSTVFLRWVFNTSENTETAELDDSTIVYNFGGVETEPSTCIVYGYLKDISDNPISGAKVNFKLVRDTNEYSEANKNVVLDPSITVKSDVNGYFQAVLIRSSEYESANVIYEVDFKKGQDVIADSLTFAVPDAETKDITDLLTAT